MTGPAAIIGPSPVTGRWVLLASDAVQICPPRTNAISFRSLESVKLAASARPPETRAGFGAIFSPSSRRATKAYGARSAAFSCVLFLTFRLSGPSHRLAGQ